jgi:hypothetical protein
MADLFITGSFDSGKLECRRDIDLALDSSGDIALTPNDEVALMQELIFYLFTEKNTRPGLPMVGCILPEIMHDKRVRGTMKRINGAISRDIQTYFPQFKGVRVMCHTVPNSPTDIFVTIIMPTGKLMEMIADFNNVMNNSLVMADLFRWGLKVT